MRRPDIFQNSQANERRRGLITEIIQEETKATLLKYKVIFLSALALYGVFITLTRYENDKMHNGIAAANFILILYTILQNQQRNAYKQRVTNLIQELRQPETAEAPRPS